ncbi:MAG: cytochrome c oxidase subunit II [Candidatus Dormiibacterota bacterium]
MTTRRHLVIPAIVVAVLSLIWDLLVALVLHIPPGYATTTAADQTVTSQVFAIIAGDIGFAVVGFGLYFAYVFSRPGAAAEAIRETGPPPRSQVLLPISWLSASFVLVMFAAGFGTIELEGQTSPSLVVPAQALAVGAQNHPLIVQVIGQQWQFTYRYPQYGGFETQQLRIPTGRLIQFDVTSLDVTHQFWAYQLGVKVDANQGVNNIGYTYVTRPTVIDVRCGELCGLWHGYMTDVGSQAGQALTPTAFASWLSYAKATYGPEEKNLPKFALTYFPEPLQYGS